ncbi:helix-turn-helix domain-containing protein [Embleya sp. MST-111070]|uniref:helix-turn-helix domain-containing protein n=1 Tax=Embleya sp. MST-111070 TaxID=3398231 RepID=UPI003F736B6F
MTAAPRPEEPAGAEPPASRPIGSCHRELGLTLYRLRLERGLSLRALARCLGYSSHSAFADFEKARRMPGEPLLVAYERLFELPQGLLLELHARALAERAARLTAIRESTVLGGMETLGTPTPTPTPTLDTSARSPAPPAAPPGPPGTDPAGKPEREVTRVNRSKRAEPPAPLDRKSRLTGFARRPKATGGLAGLGAAVAHFLGRRTDARPGARSIAKR